MTYMDETNAQVAISSKKGVQMHDTKLINIDYEISFKDVDTMCEKHR